MNRRAVLMLPSVIIVSGCKGGGGGGRPAPAPATSIPDSEKRSRVGGDAAVSQEIRQWVNDVHTSLYHLTAAIPRSKVIPGPDYCSVYSNGYENPFNNGQDGKLGWRTWVSVTLKTKSVEEARQILESVLPHASPISLRLSPDDQTSLIPSETTPRCHVDVRIDENHSSFLFLEIEFESEPVRSFDPDGDPVPPEKQWFPRIKATPDYMKPKIVAGQNLAEGDGLLTVTPK